MGRDGSQHSKPNGTSPGGKRGGGLSRHANKLGILRAPFLALLPPASPSDEVPLIKAAASRSAWKARKLLLRCSAASLVGLILILNPDSIVALGQASFFAMILSIMLPPIFAVQLFLFVSTTIILGMCLGWAWGCAAMAASLAARSQTLLASQIEIATASAAGATNPSAQFQRAVFEGRFLDWRSTAVFAAFFLVGCFALALVRVTRPKLMLLSILASIVLDVMCSYGPLFPTGRYTLATIFLIPSASYIAIGLASSILIFPETLNSSWTTDLVDKLMIPILQRSHLHSQALSTSPPSASNHEPAEWTALASKLDANQGKIAAGLEGLMAGAGMLELEASRGRLSAKDLAGLLGTLKDAGQKSVGLGAFYRTVERQRARRSAWDALKPDHSQDRTTHRMRRMDEKVEAAESRHRHSLEHLLPLLEHTSSPLRSSIDGALLGSMQWLMDGNTTRWSRQPAAEDIETRVQAQRAKVDALEAELEAYKSTGRKGLLRPFADFFDSETGKIKEVTRDELHFSPASLFVILSASENLVLFAETILLLTRQLSDLEDHRRAPKLWWPTGLRKIGNLLKGGKRSSNGVGDGDDPDQLTLVDDDDDEDANEASGAKDADGSGREDPDQLFERWRVDVRDPDARPPKNATQKVAIQLSRFGHWLHTPDVIYAIKYAVISVLLWVPQIVPASAYFAYNEKALWALIMFQTSYVTFAGDQILQTVQKLGGTIAGLLYGCVIWYIGSGNGNGSPYGVGAAFFVFMLPLIALRLFSPPSTAQFGIMMGVTTALVVGYSWQDTHLATLSNPGVGINVAWRRALLVIIGIGAALAAMLFPRPQTTRQLVRRTHATCIHEIGRLYGAIISGWISEELKSRPAKSAEEKVNNQDDHLPSSSISSLAIQHAARARMLALWNKLNSTRERIRQSAYEPSLRGDWPQEEYTRLLDVQLQLVQALAQLGSALTRLGPGWRRVLVRRTAFLNCNLISDVSSTFFLLFMALRDAHPLPEATPGPLVDRLLYHDKRLRGISESERDENGDEESRAHQTEVNGAKMGDFELTFDTLEDEHFACYATAILALSNILSSLDELELVVKQLVGEIRLLGYHQLLLQQTHHSSQDV